MIFNYNQTQALVDQIFKDLFQEKKCCQENKTTKDDEKMDSNVLKYNVAGNSKEDISITVEDGYLIIKSTNKEYPYTFSKVHLSKNVDVDKITASVVNGILTIKFTEKESSKHKINID